jgi:hypothetical protein
VSKEEASVALDILEESLAEVEKEYEREQTPEVVTA